jgi:outer membrane protein
MKSSMMKRISAVVLAFLLAFIQPGNAQELITLEDAIQIGLQQNFGILVAENEAEIARINRSPGNAGFLPRLDLSGGREEVFLTETEQVNGEASVSEDFEESLLSADVELGWTLFDGAKMFVTYQRLGELRSLGETLARVEVENTIKDIIQAYYDIVRQKQLLDVLQNSVEISEERYEYCPNQT